MGHIRLFLENQGESYSGLKDFWSSRRAPRQLDSHAVESWKATFEEFGLLYVISRSDKITITPAGFQIHQAAQDEDETAFVWTGLNLLFRYPLSGPPRSRRRPASHSDSDLLPYRFLFSAMRDLGDYFWWTELERIFCRVFATSEAKFAVNAVTEIRADPSKRTHYPLPVANRKGAFYNSLNQVANHAGMNHLTLLQDAESEHYGRPLKAVVAILIDRRFLSLISTALGDSSTAAGCRSSALYVDRLPTAPRHSDEQEYFAYLGATVQTLAATMGATAPTAVTVAGDTVFILKSGSQFEEITNSGHERIIQGSSSVLCVLARSHRVIISTDLAWTYLVTGKNLVGPDKVQLVLRRARPITNVEPFKRCLMPNVNEETLVEQGAIPPTEFGDKIERIREVADYDIELPPDFPTRLLTATKGLLIDPETLHAAAAALRAGHVVLQGHQAPANQAWLALSARSSMHPFFQSRHTRTGRFSI